MAADVSERLRADGLAMAAEALASADPPPEGWTRVAVMVPTGDAGRVADVFRDPDGRLVRVARGAAA